MDRLKLIILRFYNHCNRAVFLCMEPMGLKKSNLAVMNLNSISDKTTPK